MKRRCGWEILYKCTANSEGASQVTKSLWGSSQPQVCPRPANCKLSTNTSSSHNAQLTTAAGLVQKMPSSFCSWVCLRSDRVLTSNEPFQGSFESAQRPPLQGGLGTLVWSAPECDCCILTCPNKPHQEGKQTLVRFNRIKWGRCESTLSVTFGQFNVSLLNKSINFFRENLSPKHFAYGCCLIRQHVIECRH